MSTIVNICVTSNEDFRREFAVVDDNGALRADLQSSKLLMQVRRDGKSNLVVLQASTDPRIGGLAFLAPVNSGRFVMTFSEKVLGKVGAGEYVQDLIEETPLLIRRRIWSGTFQIIQGVSRL